MRKINEVILHCSATQEGKNYTVEDIDRWHRKRGWKGIGYHWVICLDGTIEKGRDEAQIGAHTINHNAHSIGVCTIGGLDNKGKAKDTRTEPQKVALYTLVETLIDKYNLTIENVHTHNEFANKACPSYNIEQFKEEFNNWLEDRKKETN